MGKFQQKIPQGRPARYQKCDLINKLTEIDRYIVAKLFVFQMRFRIGILH